LCPPLKRRKITTSLGENSGRRCSRGKSYILFAPRVEEGIEGLTAGFQVGGGKGLIAGEKGPGTAESGGFLAGLEEGKKIGTGGRLLAGLRGDGWDCRLGEKGGALILSGEGPLSEKKRTPKGGTSHFSELTGRKEHASY